MFEGDAAEEEGDDAGHREASGEEVAGVCAKCNEAGFDRRIVMQVGVFEEEGHPKAEGNAKNHGDGEVEEENADAMEDGFKIDFSTVKLG